ncbi:MAG: glycoside hydrolase family 97 protein [Sphingobacteriaceae bacterium]
MKQKILILVYFFTFGNVAFAQKNYTIQSQDGKLKAIVELKDRLTYTVLHDKDTVIAPSAISMQLIGGEILGSNPRIKNTKQNSVRQIVESPFYKRKQIKDEYNELILNFNGDYGVIFRAYNDGIAYRFFTSKKKDFLVENEEVTFNFISNFKSIVPFVDKKENSSFAKQFDNSFENTYTYAPLSELSSKQLAFLPLVVEVNNGKKVCITEADLESYPGLYLNHKASSNTLSGVFAPYPKKLVQGGHNKLQMLVTEGEKYIAKAKGTQKFPWRVMVVSTQDKQLADNDMVYKLASPSRVKDVSWIKPGKVAWDWWNDWNIAGVDFKSGVNNATYKYYIDFASENDIKYVILDEGWAVNLQADLMQVIPEIDVKELVDYAAKKNVDIILWAGFYALDRDMENVMKHYAGLGVKGFKVDFMNRDDQQIVDFYYRTAQTAAKYNLLVDFHGAYKPTGLQRTYPNVLNFEGVHGLEQMKWSKNSVDQVTYDVTIPFIRMVAGPMDYTQGAMRNATKKDYYPVWSDPMSQGTRCRQLAQYIVFEAPLNMLCDNPTNYMDEPECTKFISSVPETWDNTIALDGKIGEHVTIARKKGNEWYVGTLTNWDGREVELNLSFLNEGNYKAEVFRDGVNADRKPSDYKHETISIPANKRLKVSMAPGGGCAIRIYQ